MEKSVKILLVDDEPDILEFVGFNLKKENYEVSTCNNGKDALNMALSYRPDLILMDVMMPGMDGIETCEEMRRHNELDGVIIVFLSARSEDYSLIAGLNAGADDYITKPVKPKVLITKLKSLLRRKSVSGLSEVEVTHTAKEKGIVIDKERYIVIKGNSEFLLPKKEFELLALLASKPKKLFSRDEIFRIVWGEDNYISDRTIDVHVRRIRKRVGHDVIKTVKGVGYRFVDQG